MIAIAAFWIKDSIIIVFLSASFRFNKFTSAYEVIKITTASENIKIPTDLYKRIIVLHSENHAAAIIVENNNKEKICLTVH